MGTRSEDIRYKILELRQVEIASLRKVVAFLPVKKESKKKTGALLCEAQLAVQKVEVLPLLVVQLRVLVSLLIRVQLHGAVQAQVAVQAGLSLAMMKMSTTQGGNLFFYMKSFALFPVLGVFCFVKKCLHVVLYFLSVGHFYLFPSRQIDNDHDDDDERARNIVFEDFYLFLSRQW